MRPSPATSSPSAPPPPAPAPPPPPPPPRSAGPSSRLAARAEILVAFYKDSIPLPTTVNGCADTGCTSIDNESRSSAILDLSRPLSDRLLLFARYTLYFNQLQLNAPSGSYLRQTLLLSLSVSYEK